MNIFQAIIIGLLQGLTEFLPISSSGHMLLAARLVNVKISLAEQLIMHLATLLAVVVVLKNDILGMIKRPLQRENRLIVLATIPTVIVVFFLRDLVDSPLSQTLLPYCFLITAIMLLGSGFFKSKVKKEISYLDALIIGIVQGFAAFPGISRSGSTISTSLMLGNDRQKSARFSFLLSIPIIVGSSIVEVWGGGLGSVHFLSLATGFLSAFLSGFLALKFMLKWLGASFDYFAIYLLALSVLLILNDLFLFWF